MPPITRSERDALLEHSPSLTDRQKELMLTVLLRDESAFLAVKPQLKPKHFSRGDRRFALLWNAAVDLYDQYRRLPSEEMLTAEIEQKLAEVEDELTDDEVDELARMVQIAYAVKRKAIVPKYGIVKAKQFIQDSLATEVKTTTGAWAESRPKLFGRFLSQFQEQLIEVEAMDADTDEAFPDKWKPKRVAKLDTRIPFWNSFMNGGQAGGEVYGLLGPFGSCKTTLMVQTAVESALAADDLWKQGGRIGQPKRTYLASYEESKEEIRMRCLGYAAQLYRDRLENMNNWDDLAREELLPYERTRFAAALRQGLPVPTEHRRAELAMRVLNRSLKIYDMTGQDQGRGGGLDDELAALIRSDQQKHNDPGVRSVFIDYAGAAVERYLDSHDMDRKEMRQRLKTFPLHCKQKIGVPYDCSIWVAHQLSGSANAKGSAQVQQHTDAAETKSFAENLAFCFTVGTKDQTNNMCVLAKTKGRRSAGSPTAIIRVEGELWRVTDQSELYRLDVMSNRITRIADLNRVHEAREPALVGVQTHNLAQFSQAEVAGIVPDDILQAPRRLARRPRREE